MRRSSMSTQPKHDAPDLLAERLVEDILNTPGRELLAEVAEDHGDTHALAREFDNLIGPLVRKAETDSERARTATNQLGGMQRRSRGIVATSVGDWLDGS